MRPHTYQRGPAIGERNGGLAPKGVIKPMRAASVGATMRNFIRASKASSKGGGISGKRRWQRVIVRCGSGNLGTAWREWGRYMERSGAPSFDSARPEVSAETLLAAWQQAAESRESFVKIVLSPENGEGMDLQRFTREFMQTIERDHDSLYTWVAAIHKDTDHPHVHIAIRGVDSRSEPVWFSSEYIFERMIPNARRLATNQVGHVYETVVEHAQNVSRTNSGRIYESTIRR